MKKALSAILLAAALMALCACSSEPEPVELTTDNIEDYLAFSFDYSDVERQTKIGISFGYTDLTLDCYAVASGSFTDASVTVESPLTNGWGVSSADKAYNPDDTETLVCSFRLPANGSYSETHDLIAAIAYSDPDVQNIAYTITEVSGTFTPDK